MAEVKTRVLIAAPLYPPQIGGPATHALQMETWLPKQGCIVRVLPFSRVASLPKGIKHVAYFFLVLRQGIGANVIYALDPVSAGFPASLAARILGKRLVLRVGGDYAWEQGVERFGIKEMLDDYLKLEKLPFQVQTLARIQSFVARNAYKVIVPSKYLGSVVSMWGVDEKNIVVAHSAPEEFLGMERNQARKALGIPQDLFLILSAGRLVAWKGFEALIKASCATLKESPALLVIAGDGPKRKSIETAIERHKANARVRMLGRLPKDELVRWLAASDLFALNTGYEGFSHQILEAMRMGVPVLTTSVGGNKELIEHNKAGLLVPYNDEAALAEAITRLHGNAKLRGELADEGKKRVKEFSEADSIKIIAGVLKEV